MRRGDDIAIGDRQYFMHGIDQNADVLLLFFVLVPLLEAVPTLAALPKLVQTGFATLCFWVLAIGWATVWDARGRRGPLESWMRTWAG